MSGVPGHQRYGQTDGQTTYDSNTALALRASSGKNQEQSVAEDTKSNKTVQTAER